MQSFLQMLDNEEHIALGLISGFEGFSTIAQNTPGHRLFRESDLRAMGDDFAVLVGHEIDATYDHAKALSAPLDKRTMQAFQRIAETILQQAQEFANVCNRALDEYEFSE